MSYLVNPPTYVSVAQMRGFANDFDLTSYTDQQLSDKLCAASAWVNAIMRRNMIAQEKTIRYIGDGTDKLDLGKQTVLYIKRAQVVVPGPTGYAIPVNELLVDYSDGDVFEYAPLYWAGAGYRSLFPHGAPIDITLAWGFGATVALAPAFTLTDTTTGGIAIGTYNVAVTARTFWGETSALVKQYTTATGSFQANVTSGIGVYVYRIYVSAAANNTTTTESIVAGATAVTTTSQTGMSAGQQWLYDSGVGTQEVVTIASIVGSTVNFTAGTAYAHNNGVNFIPCPLLEAEMPVAAYGGLPITMQVDSLTPVQSLFPDPLPTSDTSAPALPWAIQEATRLLTLVSFFEQNNMANRGVKAIKSGNRDVTFQSTEGNSGKGVPTMVEQATSLLTPYIFQGLM